MGSDVPQRRYMLPIRALATLIGSTLRVGPPSEGCFWAFQPVKTTLNGSIGDMNRFTPQD